MYAFALKGKDVRYQFVLLCHCDMRFRVVVLRRLAWCASVCSPACLTFPCAFVFDYLLSCQYLSVGLLRGVQTEGTVH